MFPHLPQDGPLARVGAYDLTTAAGQALLRRFDAQFHRLPPEARAEAVRGLELVLPLAERAEGLLVLPGGVLAQRQEEMMLLADPASATGLLEGADALRRHVLALPGVLTLGHTAAGLRQLGAGAWPVQAASLLPQGADLAGLVPGAAEWRGAAMVHWHAGGAVVWEMVPAPPALALAASLAGEALDPDRALPAGLWAMTGSDERYQHLSSGLFAHLDEVLAQEVSDALRFALVAHWTDGEDSVASRLADGLGLLPSAFGSDPSRPPGLASLAGWPRAVAGLSPGQALLGLAAAEVGEGWDAQLRHGFLEALRALLPEAGNEAVLVTEAPAAAPAQLRLLTADRLARAPCRACAARWPLPPGQAPAALLRQVMPLAQGLGVPLLLAVPDWGLCQMLDPREGGGPGGNGAAYGLGAGLEAFEAPG